MSLNPGERLIFGDTIGEIWKNSRKFHDHDKEKEEEEDIDEVDAVDDSAI